MEEKFTKEQLEIWQKVYGLVVRTSRYHSGGSFDVSSKMTLHAIIDYKENEDLDMLIIRIYKWAIQTIWFSDVEEEDIVAIKTLEDVKTDLAKRMKEEMKGTGIGYESN